jgi:polysaccharide deacetylase family protein (PEP-CTERM system associated)
MTHAPRFALSVDVEDYFQVWAFSSVVAREDWSRFQTRFERSTRRVLELLDLRGAKATFFVLGWAAERAPALLRDIAAQGHELASHGCDHRKAFEQTPAEFLEDAVRSKRIIEDGAGVAVKGYRAPGFSIDSRTPWAHERLAAAGYSYSSSSHPIAHDHYGDPKGARVPHRPVEGSGFVEAPVATCEMFGRRVSAAGGGWFRAAPYAAFKALLDRAAATMDGPAIFYVHPWELDPGQPRIDGAPRKSRLRHYLNLGATERKLDRLLSDYPWMRIDDALGLTSVDARAA